MTIEFNNVAVRDLKSTPQQTERASLAAPETRRSAPADESDTLQNAEAPAEAESPSAGLDNSQLVELAEQTSKQFQALGRELQFEVAEQSGRTIITVLDRESGEVIRSIPPEKLVEASEYLLELRESAGKDSKAELTGLSLSDKVVA